MERFPLAESRANFREGNMEEVVLVLGLFVCFTDLEVGPDEWGGSGRARLSSAHSYSHVFSNKFLSITTVCQAPCQVPGIVKTHLAS